MGIRGIRQGMQWCAEVYQELDPLDEEDWDGWKKITERLGKKIMLVMICLLRM